MHIQLFHLFYFANLQTNGCAQHSTVYIIQIFYHNTICQLLQLVLVQFFGFQTYINPATTKNYNIDLSLYAHSCSQNQSVLQFSAYIYVSQFHHSVYIFFMLRKLCNQLQPYINHKHFTLAKILMQQPVNKLVGRSRHTKNTHPSGPKIKNKILAFNILKF